MPISHPDAPRIGGEARSSLSDTGKTARHSKSSHYLQEQTACTQALLLLRQAQANSTWPLGPAEERI